VVVQIKIVGDGDAELLCGPEHSLSGQPERSSRRSYVANSHATGYTPKPGVDECCRQWTLIPQPQREEYRQHVLDGATDAPAYDRADRKGEQRWRLRLTERTTSELPPIVRRRAATDSSQMVPLMPTGRHRDEP
jgi:hypothetical protein